VQRSEALRAGLGLPRVVNSVRLGRNPASVCSAGGAIQGALHRRWPSSRSSSKLMRARLASHAGNQARKRLGNVNSRIIWWHAIRLHGRQCSANCASLSKQRPGAIVKKPTSWQHRNIVERRSVLFCNHSLLLNAGKGCWSNTAIRLLAGAITTQSRRDDVCTVTP